MIIKKLFTMILMLSAFLSVAQVDTITEYYFGKVPERRYIIRKGDTILSEWFMRNGKISERRWSKDSIYQINHLEKTETRLFFRKKWNTPLTNYIRLGRFETQIADSMHCRMRSGEYLKTRLENDSLYWEWGYAQTHQLLEQRMVRMFKDSVLIRDETFDATHAIREIIVSADTTLLRNFIGQKQVSLERQLHGKSQWRISWDTMGRLIADSRKPNQEIKPFKDNTLCLYGFLDTSKNVFLKPQFTQIEPISISNTNNPFEIFYIVQDVNGKYGLIHSTGKYMIQPLYDDLKKWDSNNYNSNYELFQMRVGAYSGIIRWDGQVLLKPVYQHIIDEINYKFIVVQKDKFGIVDTSGHYWVEPKFHRIQWHKYIAPLYNGEYFEVSNEVAESSLWSLERGLLIPSFVGSLELLPDSLVRVELASNLAQPNSPTGIYHLRRGWLAATHQWMSPNGAIIQDISTRKYGLWAKQDFALACAYDSISKLSKMGYVCWRDGKAGLYNLEFQKWVLKTEYDDIQTLLNDEMIAYKKNNRWAWARIMEQNVIPQANLPFGMMHLPHLDVSYELYGRHFDPDIPLLFLLKGEKLELYSNETFPYPVFMAELGTSAKVLEGVLPDGRKLCFNTDGKMLTYWDDTKPIWYSNYGFVTDAQGQNVLISIEGERRILPFKGVILALSVEHNMIIYRDTITQFCGAVTLMGTKILEPHFRNIEFPDEHQLIWAAPQTLHADYQYQMYSKKGQLINQQFYNKPILWKKEIGVGQVGGKYGLWNALGDEKLTPIYDALVMDEEHNYYYAYQFLNKDKYPYHCWLFDGQGRLLNQRAFNQLSPYYKGYIWAQSGEELCILDTVGQLIIHSTDSLINSPRDWRTSLKLWDYPNYPIYDTLAKQLADFLPERRNKIWNIISSFLMPQQWLRKENNYFPSKVHFWESPNWNIMDVEISERIVNLKVNPYDGYKHKFYNIHYENGYWRRVGWSDFIENNPALEPNLNEIIRQKISQLRDVDMDCTNPVGWIEQVKENCYIQSNGIKCFIADNKKTTLVAIFLEWAILNPYLKK